MTAIFGASTLKHASARTASLLNRATAARIESVMAQANAGEAFSAHARLPRLGCKQADCLCLKQASTRGNQSPDEGVRRSGLNPSLNAY